MIWEAVGGTPGWIARSHAAQTVGHMSQGQPKHQHVEGDPFLLLVIPLMPTTVERPVGFGQNLHERVSDVGIRCVLDQHPDLVENWLTLKLGCCLAPCSRA